MWWIPKGTIATSQFAFSKFYEFKVGAKYLITYSALAYFCENYENRDTPFLIKGMKGFTYTNKI